MFCYLDCSILSCQIFFYFKQGVSLLIPSFLIIFQCFFIRINCLIFKQNLYYEINYLIIFNTMYYFICIIKDIFYFENNRYNVCHDFRYFRNQVECFTIVEKLRYINLSTIDIIGLNYFFLIFQTLQNNSKMNVMSKPFLYFI